MKVLALVLLLGQETTVEVIESPPVLQQQAAPAPVPDGCFEVMRERERQRDEKKEAVKLARNPDGNWMVVPAVVMGAMGLLTGVMIGTAFERARRQ